MKRIIFAFILICIVLPEGHSAQSSTQKYFPAQIGKTWCYSDSVSPAKFTITDTMALNGVRYFALQRNSLPEKYWYWLRSDSTKIMLLNTEDSTEHVLYDFKADPGDEWKLNINNAFIGCSWGESVRLAGKNDTLVWAGNRFTHVYHFQHFTSCFDAGLISVYFVRNLGIVQFVENNEAGPINYELDSDSVCTTIHGLVDIAGNPCTTIPCIPGVVAAIKSSNKYYVLSSNGNWQWNAPPLSWNGVNYNFGDSVSAMGVANDYVDINGKPYTSFELTDLSKETATGIRINSSGEVSEEAKLSNYPNPFNSATMIKFKVEREGEIRLNVFDLQGRLVRNLVSGNKTPGIYQIEFNAASLPSGTYFIRLSEGGQKFSKKMIYLK